MGTAAATTQTFGRQNLSSALLIALIDQHNQAIDDQHRIAALADKDGSLTDEDYEDGLTALEIPYQGYESKHAAVGPALPRDPQFLDEKVLTDIVEQVRARREDLVAFAEKVDAEIGEPALSERIGVPLVEPGMGVSARVLQGAVDLHNMIVQDWHDITAAMDGHDDVDNEDYEAELKAKTISQPS